MDLNNNGDVLFSDSATIGPLSYSIVSANGSVETLSVEEVDDISVYGAINGLDEPSIDDQGRIYFSFLGIEDDGTLGIDDFVYVLAVADEGDITTVRVTEDIYGILSWTVNGAGQLAFSASGTSDNGLFLWEDGTTTKVGSQTPDPFINASGQIAYGSGGDVYVYDDGDVSTFYDGEDDVTLRAFYDDGTVLVSQYDFSTGHTYYITDGDGLTPYDPAADQVIAEGDTLFGKTVMSVTECSRNANGDFAYPVGFDDGTSSVVVAEVASP